MAVVLKMPYPPGSYVSSEFGGRASPGGVGSTNHKGRDIAAPSGAPIPCAGDGEVMLVAYNGARGNYVQVNHGSGIITLYQHCSAIYVKVGQKVKTGQTIAAVGSTGHSTGPHLHFETWVGGTPMDPRTVATGGPISATGLGVMIEEEEVEFLPCIDFEKSSKMPVKESSSKPTKKIGTIEGTITDVMGKDNKKIHWSEPRTGAFGVAGIWGGPPKGTINIPPGLGTFATAEFDLRSDRVVTGMTSPYGFGHNTTQRLIQDLWISSGAKHDGKGFCRCKGRYIIACTTTYGQLGDSINFYLQNGSGKQVVLPCIMIDEKSQVYCDWDHNPANMWGHYNGANILEFCGIYSMITAQPYNALGLNGYSVYKAVNLGGGVR